MHILESRQQFEKVVRAGTAILFLDFEWSGQAQLSRLVIAEWERAWAVWNPRVRTDIWRASPDEQPWLVEWLPKGRGDLASGGHGALLWLRDGQIVGQENGAHVAGLRELARRTDELFAASTHESANAVSHAASSHHREIVTMDLKAVAGWDDFHSLFAGAFGFPSFYGRTLNAWIDCMTHLDDPDAGMSQITVRPGGVLTLDLEGTDALATRCPQILAALIDAAAFVNWRRIEHGEPAVLAMSYVRQS